MKTVWTLITSSWISHITSCLLYWFSSVQFSSIAQLCLTLRLHGLQHARPSCPSLTPRVYSNSCPLCWWCHPTISSSVIPFSSCLQSFPASGSFPVSQLFASHGQSVGVSASVSVLPMNIQGWFPLGLTGSFRIDLLSAKGTLRSFLHHCNWKHWWFSAQPFYGPNSQIHA